MSRSTPRWIVAAFLALTLLVVAPPRSYSQVNSDINESSFKNYYISSDEISDTDKENTFQILRKQLDSPLPLRKLLVLDSRRLKLLRNEIFARHGYQFESPELKEYFLAMPWYKPTKSYSDSLLSEIEKQNVSQIKKFEYIKTEADSETQEKQPGNDTWVDELDKSQKKPNSHIENIKGGIRFKRSNKTILFKRDDSYRDEGVYVFQDVETFKETSLVFIRTWRFNRLIGNIPLKVDAFNIDGDLLFSMNIGEADIWYDKESDLFISERHENWSGETSGRISIFDTCGNILLFENSYGTEFITPHWSKLKLVFIPSNPDKLVVFGSQRQILYQPIFQFPNLNETYGFGEATKRKIILIEPNVIYWSGINDYEPEEKGILREGLIFLDAFGPARKTQATNAVTIDWTKPRSDKSKKQLNKHIQNIPNGIRFKSTGKEIFFYKETHTDRTYGGTHYIKQLYQDVETFDKTSLVFVRTWLSGKFTPPDARFPPSTHSVKVDAYDEKGNHIFSINMPYSDIWYDNRNNVFLAEGSGHRGVTLEKIIFNMNGNISFYQDH